MRQRSLPHLPSWVAPLHALLVTARGRGRQLGIWKPGSFVSVSSLMSKTSGVPRWRISPIWRTHA
eukprot:12304638-Alexandrium_andersonii.AAC.1